MKRLLVALVALCLLPLNALAESPQKPVVLSLFINHPWYPVSEFTGIIPEEIERRTGVTLDVTIAKDTRQLNLLIASGEMPDLIYSSTALDKLSSAKLCYDYDTLIDRYDVDWDISPQLRANGLIYSGDGRLYTVINQYASTEDWQNTSSVPMSASMMIRKDILAALGNPPIRTLSDLRDVYRRVAEAYPSMVPLTFNADHRFNCFRTWFGLGLLQFVEQLDGSYRYYAHDDRYEQMLRYLNQLYRDGFILAENFAAGSSESGYLYENGLAFSHAGCTQNMNIGMQSKLSRVDPSYRSAELLPLGGSNHATSKIGWSGVFITLANRNPEASIKFIAWMFTPEAQRLTQWGREGIDYTIGPDNLPVFSKEVREAIANDTYTRVYCPWFYFGSSAIVEAEGRCALLNYPEYEEAYTAIREAYVNIPWIVAALPQGEQAEKAVFDRLESAVSDFEPRIILSATEAEFEHNYSTFQSYLNAFGVLELEAYMAKRIPLLRLEYEAP